MGKMNEKQTPDALRQVFFSLVSGDRPAAEVAGQKELQELKEQPGVQEVLFREQEAQLQITFDEDVISLIAVKEKMQQLGMHIGGYYLKNLPPSPVASPVSAGSSLEFTVGGMTCTGCEQRLERVIKKIPGVAEVKASYNQGKVRTVCAAEVAPETITAAIEKLGYTAFCSQPGLACSTAGSKTSDNFNVMQLIGIGVIMVAVWLIFDRLGIFNMLPQVNESMGYGLIFVVGLITSLHCLAMCGGINLSQSIARSDGDRDREQDIQAAKRITMSQFLPGLLYNTGRVISYTIVGGIVGSLGSVINFSSHLQGMVVMVAGFFMVVMGINMLGIFPGLKRFSVRMPRVFGNLVEKSRSRGPLIVGLLNGFMPCGPLQSMQLYALGTGSFLAGATSMFLFSLGTVPLMLGFSMVSSLLTQRFTHRMMKVSALLVLLLGTAMVSRGLSLNGFNFTSSLPSTVRNIAQVQNGKQYVKSTLTNNSYEPIFVQAGVPVEWTITATEDNLNGCNNPIIIPKYNIRKELVAGDNLIQFTPTESGTVGFSCWMGMINSSIRVVEDVAKVDDKQAEEALASIPDLLAPDAGGSAPVGVASLEGGIQKVRTELSSAGYNPIIVQRGVPVEWTITAAGSALNSCNNKLVIPKFSLTRELNAGENVIRFTPDKVEDIPYACWMDMIKSGIKVVDDLSQVDDSTIRQAQSLLTSSGCGGGGSCCATGNGRSQGLSRQTVPLNIPLDNIQLAVIRGETQYIDIDVDLKGYSPAVVVAQKGLPAKLNFRGLNLDEENYRMLVPAYGARVELKAGDNIIDFEPQGDFYFASWNNVYFGFIKVVDDLKQVDMDQVRTDVKNYQAPLFPQGSGGGCCG